MFNETSSVLPFVFLGETLNFGIQFVTLFAKVVDLGFVKALELFDFVLIIFLVLRNGALDGPGVGIFFPLFKDVEFQALVQVLELALLFQTCLASR